MTEPGVEDRDENCLSTGRRSTPAGQYRCPGRARPEGDRADGVGPPGVCGPVGTKASGAMP
jgi:hypothetical protein